MERRRLERAERVVCASLLQAQVWGCEEGVKRCSAVAQPEDMERMFRQSPAAHVHKVKVRGSAT